MSLSVSRPIGSPFYNPNAWLHYAEALEAEVERLRAALEHVATTPGVEMRGSGRDRHGVINGHATAIEIAKEALDA